ncbi:hypothetical protein [Streptomyces sp. NPDC059538]|uniref:hypothetical protein n=1 Tax=Streptomyces sp. NPDC059538 TaxID=3346860 RepID=UPI0036A6DBB9
MNLPDDLAQQRTALATALLTLQEQMVPIYDAADGMRADLQSRGWSPASAEQAALTWLCAAINMTWQPQG